MDNNKIQTQSNQIPIQRSGISGVLVDSTFWHWDEKMSKSAIELRRARDIVQKWINITVGFFVLVALFLGIIFFVSNFDNKIDSFLDFLVDPSFGMSALLFAILSTLFLFYRWQSAKDKVKVIQAPENGQISDVTTIPSLDILEKKEDISQVLSNEARKAIDEAYKLAVKGGHAEVQAVHFFLGTISSDSVRMLFMRLGIDFNALKDAIRRRMSQYQKGDTEFGISAKLLIAKSFKNALAHRRPHISVIELFAESYRSDEFLQELFYSVDVEKKELENVITWMRINEELRERYDAFRKAASFKPTGSINRAYTSVQTPFLDMVSQDITKSAVYNRLPMLIGRKKEVNEIFRSIEGGNRSVVLVGEPGTGKNTIVSGIAQLMVEERVPDILKDKRLVKLSIPHIVSAQGGSGAEERILIALQEVARSGNVVIVIEGIEQMFKGAVSGIDLSTVLASELDKGYTFVIATTNPRAYTQVIEGSALGQKMQKVIIDEPDRDQAIQVLESKIGTIENKNRVIFTYEAIATLVDLSIRYIHDVFLPEKSIHLANEAGLMVGQQGKDWAHVTKEHIAKLISEKTGVKVTHVGKKEGAELLNLEERIHRRVIGQNDAVSAISSALRRARVELRAENRPIANFLFLGPTGVGKTELAKATAEVYFGQEDNMIRFDMSEYQTPESIQKLIGGSGQVGLLTEAVRKDPFSLLLLDELEKAHPDILNIFLQVMDDGRLTDGTGRTIDMTNVILIATSNAGTQYIQDAVERGEQHDQIKDHLINNELKTVYRPEFLNRFDGVMVFKPLTMEDVIKIAHLMIKKVEDRLEAKGINFKANDQAVAELAKLGYDPKFGARPLRRVIQEEVDNAVAEFLLRGEIGRRDTLVLQSGGQIIIEKAPEL